MIAQIKLYAIGAITGAVILTIGVLEWKLHSVTKEFAEYKADIERQVALNKEATARFVKDQEVKDEKAKKDLASARSALDIALAGLHYVQDMSGDESVRVAGCSGSTVPAETSHPGRVNATLATRPGTCESSFYADALRTTLMYQKLVARCGE